MSIISILVALLLSCSANLTLHPSEVSGGGPVSASHTAPATGTVGVDDVSGGGPSI